MPRRSGSKTDLIKCPYCGEMYSVTYKHCPFCNEDGTGRWDDPAPAAAEDQEEQSGGVRGGGKRLAGGGGGISIGRVIGVILSLVLIIAASCIVFSIVRSLVGGKSPAKPTPTPTPPPPTQTVAAEVSETPAAAPSESQPVESQPAGIVTLPPAPTTPSVELIAPTSFKLNRDDFTFDHVGETFQMKVTYTPANARGDITWKSSNPNVASVSWNGVVTAVSSGTVTLTATVKGAGEQKCIVRCNFKSSSESPAPSATPKPSSAPSSSNLKLSREDFTLSRAGETYRLVLTGSSSAVTWSSSNSDVATVASDGTVKAISKGTCTVTAKVDGATLKCIVRCNF